MMRREPAMTQDFAMTRRDSQVRRAPNSAGLYDVLDLILDKGIVIDAFVRVSLVGIELLTVDLRVVIASVDTYLRYAEGAERLQLYNRGQEKKLPDMVKGGAAAGAVKKGAEKIGDAMGGGDDDKEDDDQGEGEEHNEGVGQHLAQGVRKVLTRGVGGIMKRLSGDDDDENEDDDNGKQKNPHRENGGAPHHRAEGREGKSAPHRENRRGESRSAGARR